MGFWVSRSQMISFLRLCGRRGPRGRFRSLGLCNADLGAKRILDVSWDGSENDIFQYFVIPEDDN